MIDVDGPAIAETMAARPPGQGAIFAPDEVLNGTYVIRKLIGQGGMGQVFEAHDRALNRRVAIKAARPLTPVPSMPAGDLSPLRKEAQALAAIRNPSVVTVHGLGVHLGVEYMVMELVFGTSLEAQLARRRRASQAYTIAEALGILIPLVDGLAAVHRAGIAHRDVKPANVMLTPGGRLMLMDLGIFLPEFEGPSAPIAGTPAYMAPESIAGRVEPGTWHLVDLYSTGVIAFELCTGRLPFEGATAIELLREHLTTPPPVLSSCRANLPESLSRLVAELLAKHPYDRPTAEAALWRLRAIQHEVALPAGGRAVSVLIVDDDPDALELLRACVRRAAPEVDVRTARSAAAALDALHARPADLMLLDLEMPGMNGLELCMYLQGTPHARRCPIVSISSAAEERDVRLLQELGVTQFIPKGPHIADRLAPVIRAISGRRPARS